MVDPPAPRPCESCPYRRDVPSGVWHRDEYEKLRAYDLPTFAQPVSVFLCHQQTGRLCGGWVGCHNMAQSMSFRLASVRGDIAPDDVDTVLDYHSPVPLFISGAEAADHGETGIDAPNRQAKRIIAKIERRRN